jgi:pSer/pThr/pTyr-binding forkhead associated (FHA) protein
MLAVIVLILRYVIMISLYAFLGWMIYTLWRELRFQSQSVTTQKIPMLILGLENEPDSTRKKFTSAEVIIGRDHECNFQMEDEIVSSRHARLVYRYNQWWVEDMQSTNGTYLNDERVETPTVIIKGDELRIGRQILLVDIQSLD